MCNGTEGGPIKVYKKCSSFFLAHTILIKHLPSRDFETDGVGDFGANQKYSNNVDNSCVEKYNGTAIIFLKRVNSKEYHIVSIKTVKKKNRFWFIGIFP